MQCDIQDTDAPFRHTRLRSVAKNKLITEKLQGFGKYFRLGYATAQWSLSAVYFS